MSCGKRWTEEQMLTFGWEVGLALSLVGPVHHQVPEATEAVGDLIWKNRVKESKCCFCATVQVIIRGLYAEAGAGSIFCCVRAAAAVFE